MLERNSEEIQHLLRKAVSAESADMGMVRAYQAHTDELFIKESYGFTSEYLDHFKSVKPFDSTCCGRAFGIGGPVIIPDIEQDASFKKLLKSKKAMKGINFRAIKSVPIITKKGKKLGVISIHFHEPKWNWDFNKLEGILHELSEAL